MINNNENITIIGCGISGISSAINLIEKGYKVRIIEQKKTVGGRAGSISNKYGNIDIGQHIFLDSYKNFFKLISKLDLEKDITKNENLRIPIVDNKKKYYIKSNFPIYPFSKIFKNLDHPGTSSHTLSVRRGSVYYLPHARQEEGGSFNSENVDTYI